MSKISKKTKPSKPKAATQINGQDIMGNEWAYSDEVREHFFKPQNFVTEAPKDYNGLGMVGSPACGDMMKVWLKIDSKTEKITKFFWQTFGCASAIAATSMLSVMVTEKGGKTIAEALKITPTDIIKRLSGLPSRKIHCSVLGDKALEAAINDYFQRTNQKERIKASGSRVIDKELNITDKDIEQAVKDGAKTLEEVQQKTKVGLGDPNCLPEAEELVRFYVEKYY
ncbi:iron-sulfur cluster assembly scaffold protein [Patescibacteria group bacterium]|nr:iron-sulfur cluster assembly scaffold protein [Patescibacteria group bacterium]